jgi:ComF family protein
MLVAVADTLVRTLLAPPCAACGAELAHPLRSPVCEGCWRAISQLTAPLCVRCGEPLAARRSAGPSCARCAHQPPAFAVARSAGHYDGSLRAIVHALKYGRQRLLAPPLARLMREAGADLLASADAVVPVPLHPWRLWQRGFNQADDLARGLGAPVWRVLARVRHGPPQAGLPAAQRHANVRAAFRIRRGIFGRRDLRNRVVILVDDVMTTGATLDACALALKAAGVRNVLALTAARAAAAPREPPPRSPDRAPARRR